MRLHQGVHKSVNAGSSWTAQLEGLGTYGGLEVTNLVIDPTNSQTLYISTWGDGVYKSTDGGQNWTLLTDPVNLTTTEFEGGERIRAGGARPQAIPLSIPSTNKTGAEEQLPVAPPDDAPALFPPDPLDWTPSRSLAIHPTNANRLIVAVAGMGIISVQNAGVVGQRLVCQVQHHLAAALSPLPPLTPTSFTLQEVIGVLMVASSAPPMAASTGASSPEIAPLPQS
ncbi:MAG: hypothetical protein IPL78_22880 [Chloroflexi bacterium]|nr:hypothetical protein [Chloroflexota bacterium]